MLRLSQLLFEGGVYFVQELRFVRLLFEGGHYSKAASIQRNTVASAYLKTLCDFIRSCSVYLQFLPSEHTDCAPATVTSCSASSGWSYYSLVPRPGG